MIFKLSCKTEACAALFILGSSQVVPVVLSAEQHVLSLKTVKCHLQERLNLDVYS